MPFSRRHREQKSKNATFLVILILWVALLFIVSLVKIAGI